MNGRERPKDPDPRGGRDLLRLSGASNIDKPAHA